MPFSYRYGCHSPGYRTNSGFAVPAWPAAESLPQLFPLQPDEQLGTANVQMLADSLWAHSAMDHSDNLAAEGDMVPCRYFALARIGAAESCGEPVSSSVLKYGELPAKWHVFSKIYRYIPELPEAE